MCVSVCMCLCTWPSFSLEYSLVACRCERFFVWEGNVRTCLCLWPSWLCKVACGCVLLCVGGVGQGRRLCMIVCQCVYVLVHVA